MMLRREAGLLAKAAPQHKPCHDVVFSALGAEATLYSISISRYLGASKEGVVTEKDRSQRNCRVESWPRSADRGTEL